MKLAPWLSSGLLHVAIGGAVVVCLPGAAGNAARSGLGPVGEAALRAERPLEARRRRAELVTEARAARANGSLALGDFLLQANEIDAEGEGRPFDIAEARRLFAARVARLRGAVARTPLDLAVASTFEDLAYTGTPGGLMSEVLFAKRGSCEPVSHLVVATLHDAGLGSGASLRFYGGTSAGVTHLAPLLVLEERVQQRVVRREIDLTRGREPLAGGVTFAPEDLVEVYARAHGLAPPLSSVPRPAGEEPDSFLVPASRTMTSGYPPNADRFDGALPLFAERAVIGPTPQREGGGDTSPFEAPPCAVHVSLAWLDAPSAMAMSAHAARVELVREPSQEQLESLSTTIMAIESARRPDDALASRLLGHACLVALYERAGLLFSLGNQRAVSLRAMKSREREARAGKVALAELMALSTARRHDLERELAELSMGRVWVLLFLEGGSDAVVAMATLPQSAFSGTLSVAALLVSPDTRARGVEIADSLKLSEQIDLMHELMHAHDNARPWAASYKLDLARTLSTSPFAKKNRVFAALAWRLWDGGRQPEEAVAALVREGAAEQLDKRSQDAIADYYMQSYFRLMRQRQGGDEMIDRADKALVASGFRGLASLSQADLDGRIPRPEGL